MRKERECGRIPSKPVGSATGQTQLIFQRAWKHKPHHGVSPPSGKKIGQFHPEAISDWLRATLNEALLASGDTLVKGNSQKAAAVSNWGGSIMGQKSQAEHKQHLQGKPIRAPSVGFIPSVSTWTLPPTPAPRT